MKETSSGSPPPTVLDRYEQRSRPHRLSPGRASLRGGGEGHQMIITTKAIMATKPCDDYPIERVAKLVGDELDPMAESTLDLVLDLPRADALRVLPRLLTRRNCVAWAQACAERTESYAAEVEAASYAVSPDYASYYAVATYHAVTNADYAEAAARYASYYAAEAASPDYVAVEVAMAAEHRTACQHALQLIAAQHLRFSSPTRSGLI